MQPLLDAVSALRPVGLDGADPSATARRRVDRKYLVDPATVVELVASLDTGWRVLEIDGGRLLPYDNVYFDTADRRLHHAAVQRKRRRVKVRTRRYGADEHAPVVVEAKHKGVRGETLKERRAVVADAHGDPTGALDGFDEAGALLASLGVTADGLLPAIHTSYRRLTLVGPDGTRVTIDVDVVCENDHGRVVFGDLIVETKSPGPPTEADRFLWGRGVRPLRLSKCSTPLSMLEPECGGNRWHRTVGRHDIRLEASGRGTSASEAQVPNTDGAGSSS